MFKKKKKSTLYSSVGEGRSTVYDFMLRSTASGYESYRTAEYGLYHKLDESEMLPRLDEHLEKLFAGEVDDGNGDMLDAIIFGPAREALPQLASRKVDHEDTIRRLIIRRTADRADICRIRDERIAEYEDIRRDYDEICKALKETEGVI